MMKNVMMFAILAWGIQGLPESSSAGESEPACLLQSTFSSGDVSPNEGRPNSRKSTVLVESGVVEETITNKLMTQCTTRSKSYKAHLLYLKRHVNEKQLEHAKNVSNVKIQEVVDGFIRAQSGAQDASSSQLMEAKHQLNQLHEYVMDLVLQVNTTERAIVALDKAMEEELKEIKKLDKWKAEELKKCEVKKQEYIEMYVKLGNEMKEMKQIASPGVSLDIKTGIVNTREGAAEVGFVQIPNLNDMQKLQGLLAVTQTAKKQYLQCMNLKFGATPRLLQFNNQSVMGPTVASDATITGENGDLGAGANDEGPDMGPTVASDGAIAGADGDLAVGANGANGDLAVGANGAGINDADANNMVDVVANDGRENDKPFVPTSENCANEKNALQETYVKTFVELSRLKDEYHELANSTACFDNVAATYKLKKQPHQEKIDELIKDIDKKIKELQQLRPQLEKAKESETKLTKHIKTLKEEVAELPETVSNLNKVRDAIQALSKCPGLSRIQFDLPKWTGTYAVVQLDATKMNDAEIDAALNEACGKQGGARAAEVAEIEEQTVEGIPLNNTADFPLIGTCPACEGDEAANFPSGHKRVCWSTGKELSHKKDHKGTNCAGGKKAVLCVTDRENFRQIPGEGK